MSKDRNARHKTANMHTEGAEKEKNCDFDRTRERPLSLISGKKTFNWLGDNGNVFRKKKKNNFSRR